MGDIYKKVPESRLTWYGHVFRREDMRVMAMEVPGEIRRGRPKRRWMDSIRNELLERNCKERKSKTVLIKWVS